MVYMEDELDLTSIQAIVDNYVEPEDMLGWKYTYMCFTKDYFNKDKTYFLDDVGGISESELYNLADFWVYRSLVSDFILDYEISYIGNNVGKIKLFFK